MIAKNWVSLILIYGDSVLNSIFKGSLNPPLIQDMLYYMLVSSLIYYSIHNEILLVDLYDYV